MEQFIRTPERARSGQFHAISRTMRMAINEHNVYAVEIHKSNNEEKTKNNFNIQSARIQNN